MQFNVTNGPVTTWDIAQNAYRLGKRPTYYDHRTSSHPSIYDDYDSIMAAAWLLSWGRVGGLPVTTDCCGSRMSFLDTLGAGVAGSNPAVPMFAKSGTSSTARGRRA